MKQAPPFQLTITPLFPEIDHAEIKNYIINNLPLEGTLKQLEGFVYLDISDDYIYALIPFIAEEGFDIPPYFGDSLVGAHITAITPEECPFPLDIPELGKEIPFTLKENLIVTSPSKDIFFIITVDCPDLEKIREQLGLSPIPEHAFHITIGACLENEEPPLEMN